MSNNTNQQVEELQRLVIKEEFYNLTGDHFAAALLNNMIFWQRIVDKGDKNLQSRIDQLEKQNSKDKEKRIQALENKKRHGWFYKTNEEWLLEVMNWSSITTIHRRIKEFVAKGWVDKGVNPDPKKKWDRTAWYKVNLDKIAADLHELGYALEGYTLYQPTEEKAGESAPQSIFHCAKSISHDEKSILHSEKSILHSERTIPESINHKVLTESSNITNLSKEIAALDIPVTIQKVLTEHVEEIDRLIRKNKMSLLDVQVTFNSSKLNAHDFALKVHDVLTNGIKSNFKNCLHTAIENMIKDTNSKKAVQAKEPVRKEMVPEFLKAQKEAAATKEESGADQTTLTVEDLEKVAKWYRNGHKVSPDLIEQLLLLGLLDESEVSGLQ
ncbi:hypothetical protein [Priestia aryabhattai]|uniref:Uncharacterized protein n=1 Tax=Priestia aryabhattai TaxID=412384 RepID=A0ABD7X3T4_PRIAR|nr:hypothetical protein [Priestia aryabhattai]WEA47306.1 hypothetical protein PWO00_28435 [Priestia aryabhattai]